MPYIVAIVWVTPVVLGVFVGGTYLFTSIGGFGGLESSFSFIWPPLVLISIYLSLLIPPTWVAHLYAPWFMEQRRCGRWG
jgi:hypothetical protein